MCVCDLCMIERQRQRQTERERGVGILKWYKREDSLENQIDIFGYKSNDIRIKMKLRK